MVKTGPSAWFSWLESMSISFCGVKAKLYLDDLEVLLLLQHEFLSFVVLFLDLRELD